MYAQVTDIFFDTIESRLSTQVHKNELKVYFPALSDSFCEP
jgi:hypothetical protein